MRFQQFEELENFPIEMVTNTRYSVVKDGVVLLKLKPGDTFMAHGKRIVGEYDYSIVDQFGHLHFYMDCDLLYPDVN